MAVGEVDVEALLARISSRALTEWMAYFSLEPFGEEQADWRMAVIASLLANANRDPSKRKEPFRVEEFMPRFEALSEEGPEEGQVQDLPRPPQRRQTWEQQQAIMMAMTRQRIASQNE